MDLSGDFVTIDVGEKKNQKIKIVGTYEDPYFCGKDVCEILEYKYIKQALREHVKEKHKKDLRLLSNEVGGIPNSFGSNNLKNLTYHSGKAVYISKEGLISLLLRSKRANAPLVAEKLSDALGLDIKMFLVASKEQNTIGSLIQSFSHLKPRQQFSIGKYRIDLYFPNQKVAVECDEKGHTDRDPIYEQQREEFIREQLNCKFFRFNPDCKTFNIFTTIQKLMVLLYDKKR
jgi:very-short-patch-repair endonuclease